MPSYPNSTILTPPKLTHFPPLAAECIYTKNWLPGPQAAPPITTTLGGSSKPAVPVGPSTKQLTRASNDAKLIFGTVFSLRNIVRKLGGEDDAFISYRTGQYRMHYYETPTNLRFVMLTDTGTMSMRNVLHQVYINLWVEYGKWRAAGREGGLKSYRCACALMLTLDFFWFSQWSRILSRRSSTRAARACATSYSSWVSTNSSGACSERQRHQTPPDINPDRPKNANVDQP